MQIDLGTVSSLAWRIKAEAALAQRKGEVRLEGGGDMYGMFALGQASGMEAAAAILLEFVAHREEYGDPCAPYSDDPSEGKPYYALRDGTLVSDAQGGDA